MKTVLTHWRLVTVLAFGIASQGCSIVDGPCERGKGDIVRRALDIEAFAGINMTMAGTVTIERGETLSVEIEGQPNILDLISTDVEDGQWTIYPRSCISNHKDFSVFITLPELENIILTGSGSITTLDSFDDDVDILLSGSGKITYAGQGEKANVALTGSGKITFTGDFTNVTVSHSGSGSVLLSGAADFLKATCSGSGGIDAYEMAATKAQVVNSGSGSSKVHVTDELEAVVSGSGSIFYRGDAVVDETDNGSGSIVNDN
ncbi:head GIN domain-containing protein [Imperialibacter roseus]|uniref:Head GIN domain-containing protein n=1 Tax=Imperialibacter roseus TaxID=1324217 RepID=A0ABZ0IX13_9BACT|nr:head GIN domain-containing protein [Imperialibacter roseus]WOK09573.1 head GIN domain-containing protein [Imperialibacter roseus]